MYFLAIAKNIPQWLKTGFVVHGHGATNATSIGCNFQNETKLIRSHLLTLVDTLAKMNYQLEIYIFFT